MKNVEYIIREEGTAKFYDSSSGDKVNIRSILEKYSYILESLEEEKYEIRMGICDLFKELIYNQKVVGFCTYHIHGVNYILTNIYIVPGYRRQLIFYHEIESQFTEGNVVSIYEPTRQVVDILIKLGYARIITESLVVSALNFNMNLSSALTVGKNNILENRFTLTNLYDLGICSTLSFRIYNKREYEVYYTRVFKDDKRFGCEEKRNKIDGSYFENIVSTLIERDSEIERWLFLLEHHLPTKKVNVEDIIGTTNSFSQRLQQRIDEGVLTRKEAKIIQNQLFVEKRMGKVVDEALSLRLDYLISHIHDKKRKKIFSDKFCPYCDEQTDDLGNYCFNCGYTLYDISSVDEEEFVYRELWEEKLSYKYSLNGVMEKKDYFDQEYLKIVSISHVLYNIELDNYSEEMFEVISDNYNLENIDLRKIMVDEGYLSYKMTPENWDMVAQNYKNVELKEILSNHGLKKSGNKRELIERIKNEVSLDEFESDIPEITERGYAFQEDYKELLFHESTLKDYIFDEFLECVNENKGNEELSEEKVLTFLEKHVSKAVEARNHEQLVTSLRKKAFFYSRLKDYHKGLWNEMYIFMANLNMLYIDSSYYKFYKPIEKETRDSLMEFTRILSEDEVKDIFYEVYNQFKEEDLKVSYIDTLDTLKHIFKGFALSSLNNRIRNRYYRKKEYKIIPRINPNSKSKRTTLDKFFKHY